MKIISKYKDYYDYLQGINGIDPLVILDRTEFSPKLYQPSDGLIVRFVICGYLVEGLVKGGKFLYGDEIEQFSSTEKFYHWEDNADDYFYIKGNSKYSYESKVLKKPRLMTGESPNDILNCPILIRDAFGKHYIDDRRYSKFPILKDYDLVKVFSPEEIWIMLYNWISREVIIKDNQTDKEKIVSKGFDLKHSFRNTK